MNEGRTRRQLLALLGSTSVGVSAGCLQDSAESDSTDDDEPTPTPQHTVPAVDCNPEEYQSVSTERPTGAWTPTRGNQRRTGANLEMEPLELADSTELAATTLLETSSISLPVIATGTVYVTDLDNMSRAIDVETGETEWTTRTEANGRFPPLVTEDTVYFPGYTGRVLRAIERKTGTHRWIAELDGQGSGHTSPVIAGDTAIVGHTQGQGDDQQSWFTGLDVQCGSRQWSQSFEQEFPLGLATDGETAYGTSTHHLYALAGEDGTKHWQVDFSGNYLDNDAPPAVAGDTVIVKVGDNIHALQTADGSNRWNTRDGPNAEFPPTIAEGQVFLVEEDPYRVHALDIETGETQWTFTESRGKLKTAPTYVGGFLYIFGPDRKILELDAKTGKIRAEAKFSINGSFGNIHRLAITPNGILTRDDPTEGQKSDVLTRVFLD